MVVCEDCKYFYKVDVTYVKMAYCSLRNKDIKILRYLRQRRNGVVVMIQLQLFWMMINQCVIIMMEGRVGKSKRILQLDWMKKGRQCGKSQSIREVLEDWQKKHPDGDCIIGKDGAYLIDWSKDTHSIFPEKCRREIRGFNIQGNRMLDDTAFVKEMTEKMYIDIFSELTRSVPACSKNWVKKDKLELRKAEDDK